VKRSKYGNVWTEVDGIKFQSKAEARRYSELKLLERSGEITDLILQPAYQLQCTHHKSGPFNVGRYVADFSYTDSRGTWVVEDVKGIETAIFKWKRRHFEAQSGQKITIIK
jgi:hypothetical protein